MHLSIEGLAVLLAAGALTAGAGRSPPTLEPLNEPLRLDGALAEVSGLAPSGAASVYAHNDEQAAIHDIDLVSGKTLRSITLGRPPVRGDFEAIVAQGNRLALFTSDGRFIETDVDPHRRSLDFRMADARIGADCEIEGVAAADEGYFFACKRARGRLVIYRWARGADAEKIIDRKLKGAVPNPDGFRAADLVRDPATGAFLVLDSSAGAILELSAAGKPLAYWRLGGDHPQAEGLALLADGRLVVADEAAPDEGRPRSGTLTLYPPRR